MNMTSGLTLGQVFGRTMQIFRDGYKQVFLGVVLPLGVVTGLLSAGIAVLQSHVAEAFFLPLYFGLILVAAVIGVVGVGALAHASVGVTAGRPVIASESWRQGIRFKVWGTVILSAIGVGLGLMCCLLPGLYLIVAWSLAFPIIFEEAIFHSGALSRSHELARFNPQGGIENDPRFRMFLVYGAAFGTMYLLVTLAQLPMFILIFASIARDTSSGVKPGDFPAFIQWVQVPTSLVTSLIQHSMTFMANIGAAVVYFDIRGRQEATDLKTAIEEMGAPPDA